MKDSIERYHEDIPEPYPSRFLWIGVLSYALTQGRLPFIEEIAVVNNTKEVRSGLTLKISFEFDFIEDYVEDLGDLQPGEFFERSPKLKIVARKLFELSEMMRDRLSVVVTDGEGEVMFEMTEDFPVLPMNQWSGMSLFCESIAGFVLPNVPQVTQLQGRAAQILKETTGDSAFTGYLSEDKNTVRKQLAAIYATIYEQNINYALPPASFFELGQRVRLPHEVLESKIGTCIEMSILFASLCEAFGLHPFLVVIEGHAFVGCWLIESVFDRNVVGDIAEIKKRLVDGINEIELIEATYLNSGSHKNFEQATRSARARLEDASKFVAVIDIFRCHYCGIRPMAIQVVENGQVKVVDYGLAEDADSKAVVSKSIEEYFLDTSKQDTVDKCTIWMRNLLDLSKRNALISFRNGSKSIQLFASNLGLLEDTLSKGEAFTLREVVDDWHGSKKGIDFADIESQEEFVEKISAVEFKSRRLRTF